MRFEVRPKYAQRCLAEFEYRFNRRFDLPAITPRLIHVALRRPPMPERLLTLRLAWEVVTNQDHRSRLNELE